MRLALGSDHGGFRLKEAIKAHLTEQNIEFHDFGTYTADSVDYPDVAKDVAQAITSGQYEQGILICGTGIGISIAANKVKGIRAALCSDDFSAQMARQHNNANILALGERVLGIGLALHIVDTFLNTPFEGGRHARRVDKISQLEE